MTKATAKVKRINRALKANHGNLHKAQFGKASSMLPLPDAPKETDFGQQMPKSLKRMLAFKNAAENPIEKKTRNKYAGMKQGRAQSGAQPSSVPQNHAHLTAPKPTDPSTSQPTSDSAITNTSSKKQQKQQKQQQQQQQQQQKDGDGSQGSKGEKGGKGSGGKGAAMEDVRDGSQGGEGSKGGKGNKGGKGSGAKGVAEEEVKKGKDRKKEYLRQKEVKKKAKKGNLDLTLTEKEMDLRAKAGPKFGEVAHAPLQVHLKRKNWVDTEKKSNERCKQLFLKQMHAAEQRMTGSLVDAGAAAKKQKLQADEQELVRQQVIQAYREKNSQSTTVGGASLGTLSKLAHQKKSNVSVIR